MDYEDDDIYPENEVTAVTNQNQNRVSAVDVDDEEEGEEVESDDSDDDILISTEAKDTPKVEPSSQDKSRASTSAVQLDVRKASGTPQPSQIKRETTPLLGVGNINRIETPDSVSNRPGSSYPGRHTSKLDPENGNPVHPQTGKPIMSTDFDADFPGEDAKPWRKPGADVTDWFNYGFDEFTWASWCLKKQQMPQEVKSISKEWDQMRGLLDGIGSAPTGMPGAMPGMLGAPAAGMPGMPGMTEQDMAMMQQMMASGMDPSTMTPEQFGQMMMGGGMGAFGGQGMGAQATQQPPAGPAAYNGGFQDNFAGRGRGKRHGKW